MEQLRRLIIRGYKSIRELDLELRPLTVLVGANGVGKSNLLSLFGMLAAEGTELDDWVAEQGGASAIPHYGPKVTHKVEVVLRFEGSQFTCAYRVVPPDRLSSRTVVGMAIVEPEREPDTTVPLAAEGQPAAPDQTVFPRLVTRFRRHYHFHDTSSLAPIRQTCSIHDNRELRADGGNLAAVLYLLKDRYAQHYDRIVRLTQLAFPQFGGFELVRELQPDHTMLNWRERDRDPLFGPHQVSDGTLRFMALTTLLNQPDERLPGALVLDEPELGLHPYALSLLAGMIRSASEATQVIVATQSARLVDEFDPEDIVVVERHQGASAFRRLDAGELSEWLQDYSLGQLWERNVFGGRPSR